MSIYDQREQPAYKFHTSNPTYAKNQHILKWWDSSLDELLVEQISLWQWVWYWGITEEIAKHTAPKIINKWKRADPICRSYAWYNVLMYFAISRAEKMGYTKSIRQPQKKICPLCKNSFVEDSLPMPFVKRLGINKIDFCAPCLKDIIFLDQCNNSLSKDEILKYLHDLALIIGRVPPKHFGGGMMDLIDLNTDERLSLFLLLRNKPSTKYVEESFGSWLNALIQAGVLEDGTRKTSRGIQTIAKDGHVCLSLGEKTIDDYLYTHGIQHEKEPRYPASNYRGDFKVGAIFIEYFGLAGNAEYDAKIKEKIRLCKKYNIALVAIYPRDLITQQALERKMSSLNKQVE